MKRFSPLSLVGALLLAVGCDAPAPHTADDFTLALYTPAYASGFEIRGLAGDTPAQPAPTGQTPQIAQIPPTATGTAPQSRPADAAKPAAVPPRPAAAPHSPTLLTIRNPWQGARGVEQQVLILRGDATAPAGFEGTVVRAPLRRVVCLSSSFVAMFDALGEIARVKGVSGIDYLSNAYVAEHRACGEVRDVGPDTNLDYELLAAMRPDAVLLYGVTGANSVAEAKLAALGIPYINLGDYTETSPLGKAEWLVAVAELCDRRAEGEALFGRIEARYEARRAQVAAYVEERAPDIACRPRVLLNTPYRDTWFLPSSENYIVRLIRDAGGDAFTAAGDGNASQPVELEQAYLLAADADLWLHTGSCNTLAELRSQNPRFAEVPAVRQGRVWNNNRLQTPAGGSDFWESGVVRPDVVLDDLFQIFYPDNGLDYTPVYYHALR